MGSYPAFVAEDPGMLETGMSVDIEHPVFGTIRRHGLPVHFSETPGRIATSCTRGEHTRPILEELGYSPAGHRSARAQRRRVRSGIERRLRKGPLMKLDDLILVSIDDHVIEPADMFDHHMPAKYADQAPRIVVSESGVEQWEFQGNVAGTIALNAVVGWPKEDWGFDPVNFAEMRPGAHNVHDRVRDMNVNGVLASMCFPTFIGFNGGALQNAPDKDLATIVRSAPTTTGTSTSGRPRIPAGSSRSPSHRCGTRRPWSSRCAGSPPKAAARSRCPSCPTSWACPATTTSTTGTRSS